MNKIPSAKELLNTIYNDDYRSSYKTFYSDQCVEKSMIEFAKLHVEAALKIASEKGVTELRSEGNSDDQIVNKDSILNAYPLENIK